jgi:hypothetical protein
MAPPVKRNLGSAEPFTGSTLARARHDSTRRHPLTTSEDMMIATGTKHLPGKKKVSGRLSSLPRFLSPSGVALVLSSLPRAMMRQEVSFATPELLAVFLEKCAADPGFATQHAVFAHNATQLVKFMSKVRRARDTAVCRVLPAFIFSSRALFRSTLRQTARASPARSRP